MGALFVMGLGMGCTMMPLMTAAIVTLSNEQIARGSTLMNIVQQTAGSIGTAVMSVVLTNQLLDRGLDTTMVGAASHIPTEPGKSAGVCCEFDSQCGVGRFRQHLPSLPLC